MISSIFGISWQAFCPGIVSIAFGILIILEALNMWSLLRRIFDDSSFDKISRESGFTVIIVIAGILLILVGVRTMFF